jgi:phospholipid transport system substrate-binding protein
MTLPMHVKYFKRKILLILCLVLIPIVAPGGEPADSIKAVTDRLLTVVSDNGLKAPDKKEERDRLIMETVDGLFSWEEFSKRTLAKNWNKRTIEERKDFVSLVRQLIADTYMEKTYRYSGESITYLDEKVEGDYGSVTSVFNTSNGAKIPVDYRVMKKDGTWCVYDLYIEGVSLVSNYRSQFNSVITGSSYEELVRRLRSKLKQ